MLGCHSYTSVTCTCICKFSQIWHTDCCDHIWASERSPQGWLGDRSFWQCLACPLCVMFYFPHLWIYMDIVFGQLHLLMSGTELEAVPADTVSFELCIYSYLRASCVHSDRVCRLYLFIINVLLLFECRWSHSLHILLHVRNASLLLIHTRKCV